MNYKSISFCTYILRNVYHLHIENYDELPIEVCTSLEFRL